MTGVAASQATKRSTVVRTRGRCGPSTWDNVTSPSAFSSASARLSDLLLSPGKASSSSSPKCPGVHPNSAQPYSGRAAGLMGSNGRAPSLHASCWRRGPLRPQFVERRNFIFFALRLPLATTPVCSCVYSGPTLLEESRPVALRDPREERTVPQKSTAARCCFVWARLCRAPAKLWCAA